MDLFVVTCRRDLALLRLCLLSADLFYRERGRIVVVADREDEALLAEMELPAGTRILYKQDRPELAGASGFAAQLWLKLNSWRLVETERYLVVDSDFLFVAPTRDTDFCTDGVPDWFYGPWGPEGSPARRWLAGSSALVGAAMEHYYGEGAQWVFQRDLARRLAEEVDLDALLTREDVAEFAVYGWWCHRRYPGAYNWHPLPGPRRPVVEKVNQRPPSYCELDPGVGLDDFPDARVLVFWSHWELAARRMGELFEEAQRRHLGRVEVPAPTDPLLPPLRGSLALPALARSAAGVAEDGWVDPVVRMAVAPAAGSELTLEVQVPERPPRLAPRLACTVVVDGQLVFENELPPGTHRLFAALPATGVTRRVEVIWGGGFVAPEGGDDRELRARLTGVGLGQGG